MLDVTALKMGGFIMQRTGDAFTVRIRVPGGRVTEDQLAAMHHAAHKYGRGYVHLTSRQGFELPWVKAEDFEALRADLAKVDLVPAGCGPRVRNVTACPGIETCARGLVDTYALARQLSDKYVGKEVVIKKLKMSVSGCPNSCTAPQHNDLGFVATVEPELVADRCSACGICVDVCREKAISMNGDSAVIDRSLCLNCGVCIASCPTEAVVARRAGFTVFLGGKVGRHPQLGRQVAEFVPGTEVSHWVEGLLSFLEAKGNRNERLGSLVDRLGIEALSDYLPQGARA